MICLCVPQVVSCIEQVQAQLVKACPELRPCLLEPVTAHLTVMVLHLPTQVGVHGCCGGLLCSILGMFGNVCELGVVVAVRGLFCMVASVNGWMLSAHAATCSADLHYLVLAALRTLRQGPVSSSSHLQA